MFYIQVIYDKFMKYVKELVHMGRFLSYHLCESSWLTLTHVQVSQLLFMWIVLFDIDDIETVHSEYYLLQAKDVSSNSDTGYVIKYLNVTNYKRQTHQ